MLDKLQDILKWLSKADEWEIDGLWQILINDKLWYLEDVKGKTLYEEFINNIIKENE